jgi:ketosteroid isomerase-like protein
MNLTISRPALSSLALVVLLGGPACASPSSMREAVDATIKAHVRDIVSGINTRNADLATSHDAATIISMQTNQPNTVGAAADASDFRKGFASDPSWRVSLVEEAVDVAEAGDMAVYRSIYNQDGTQSNVPVTQKVNFVSGWSRREDGIWAMNWYVVLEIEKPHKR